MASPIHHPDSPIPPEPPWVRLEPVASWVWLEPVRFQHLLLDGYWWPSTNDLEVELCVLVPVLDQVRGPVAKVLVSPAGWIARPHDFVAAGRTVAVGYLAGQSPQLMTVLCTDGGTLTLRVAPPGPASGASDWSASGVEDDVRENADGAFGPLCDRVLR